MRVYFAIGMLVTLMGCEATEYGGRCSRYGFIPGTDAYAQCIQRLDMSRDRYERRPYHPSPVYDDY